MGYDKDTPRKPTLASRPFTRAPLTPKIAASSTPSRTPTLSSNNSYSSNNNSTSPYQTVTVSTPLARRVTGLSSTSNSSSSHYHSGNNDTTSPAPSSGAGVPSYLNNVTPRSGARQSRVDGGSTTPTGTPNGQGYGLGIGVTGNNNSASSDPDSKFFYASEAKSSVSVAPSASAAAHASHSTPTPTLAMAGHSSSSLAATPSGRPASTFFYANGKSLPPANGHSPASASTSAFPAHIPPPMVSPTLSSTPAASKFVHANGAALERKLSSSSSTRRAPATPTMAQQQQHQQHQASASSRPLSPVKMAAVSPYPLQKSMSFPVVPSTSSGSSSVNGSTYNANSSTGHRPSIPGNLSLNAAATAVGTQPLVASPGPVSPGSGRLDVISRQRSNFSASIGSIGSNSSAGGGGGHSRKGSLTIADPPTVARLLHSSQPNSEVPSPASGQFPAYPFPSVSSPGASSNGTNNAASSGLAAILQAADDLAEDDEGSEADHNEDGEGSHGDDDHTGGKDSRRSSTNVSASGAGHTHSQVDELVTMARRERKVQDLEITNASLEAINRSLERQLRKQKNELRQFRRLSRSGRLSLAPSTAPGGSVGGGSRITSSSTVEGPIQDMDQLLGEDDSFLEEFDDEYGSDMEVSYNEDEDDDSSSSYSEGDTRRKRDERRLQLDLAQHRQLLVDSQKINQSIKRCMNWTEALIQEGQKALAFQVRVSEVQLGGRVLAADEVEEREQRERDAKANDASERSALLLKESELLLEDDDHFDDQSELNVAHDIESVAALKVDGAVEASVVAADATSADASTSSTANTPASSSTDDHDQANRDEAFSPISHNIRTVRFDTGDGDEKADAPVKVDVPSLDNIATASVPEAGQVEAASELDTMPDTPSKPPPAPVVEDAAPILRSPPEPAPAQDVVAAPPDVAATLTETPPTAVPAEVATATT
ncbi:hypothetical protein Sste5346_005155 [Sporothrix stenoceras]|uniref:Uncharacterized protein n=1 Tax=Sporothrix stenoceras TaxID=5173 RepID=A0ABR3Z832_9PEZI